MQNNPEANIRTDFGINDVVTPKCMNAIAESIQYDYVVTADMLQNGIDGESNEIDVDGLLGGHKIAACTGEYHVLINANVANGLVLKFDGSSVGGPSGELRVHVHALGPYTAKVTGTHPQVYFYFHTRGEKGAVTLTEIGHNTYVGSFNMTEVVQAPIAATFIYEMALGELPDEAEHRLTIEQKPWMSNSIKGGNGSNTLIIGDYPQSAGYAIGNFTVPANVEKDGRTIDKAVDMSNISEIKWLVGSIAAHTADWSESLLLEGGIPPYSTECTRKYTYRGGGPDHRTVISTGVLDVHITDGVVGGSITRGVMKIDSYPMDTQGSFTNATVTYDGETYTGVDGNWTMEGTASFGAPGISISGALVKSGTITDVTSESGGTTPEGDISGSMYGGTVRITFESNGIEGSLYGDINIGGFAYHPGLLAITCGFSHVTLGATLGPNRTGYITATISAGDFTHKNLYLPELFLDTSTMEENRLYHARIEYMYDPATEGQLDPNYDYDYSANIVPSYAGRTPEVVSTIPRAGRDLSPAILANYANAACTCAPESESTAQFTFKAGNNVVCNLPYDVSGYGDPNDPNNISTWSWTNWAWDAYDRTLSTTGSQTINGETVTMTVYIIAAHEEMQVFRSAGYIMPFPIHFDVETYPIYDREIAYEEQRQTIYPRIFCRDETSKTAACQDYRVPQWIGDAYLMKRDGKVRVWGF